MRQWHMDRPYNSCTYTSAVHLQYNNRHMDHGRLLSTGWAAYSRSMDGCVHAHERCTDRRLASASADTVTPSPATYAPANSAPTIAWPARRPDRSGKGTREAKVSVALDACQKALTLLEQPLDLLLGPLAPL